MLAPSRIPSSPITTPPRNTLLPGASPNLPSGVGFPHRPSTPNMHVKTAQTRWNRVRVSINHFTEQRFRTGEAERAVQKSCIYIYIYLYIYVYSQKYRRRLFSVVEI